jgi:hypothetical protein
MSPTFRTTVILLDLLGYGSVVTRHSPAVSCTLHASQIHSWDGRSGIADAMTLYFEPHTEALQIGSLDALSCNTGLACKSQN